VLGNINIIVLKTIKYAGKSYQIHKSAIHTMLTFNRVELLFKKKKITFNFWSWRKIYERLLLFYIDSITQPVVHKTCEKLNTTLNPLKNNVYSYTLLRMPTHRRQRKRNLKKCKTPRSHDLRATRTLGKLHVSIWREMRGHV